MKQYIYSSSIGLIILAVLQFITLSPNDSTLRVYFLDVGQGDSALIRYSTGERLLIDTGKDSQIFRELDQVLPWYDKKIHYVLLTHGDLDHVGAMIELLDRYRIEKIFVSEFFGQIEVEKEIAEKAKQKNTTIEILKQGDILTFGTLIQNSFKILHPDSKCMIIFNNENDCSLVGLLSYGENTFLFTGDIGKEVEKNISKNISEPITLLKVAHHGSKNSTGEEFIQKTKPEYSIISVGENGYGHPAPEVLSTLSQASSSVWSTKEAATIVAASDGTSLEVKKLFNQARFFQSNICTILLYGFDASC
jgi:competence protein ComEC